VKLQAIASDMFRCLVLSRVIALSKREKDIPNVSSFLVIHRAFGHCTGFTLHLFFPATYFQLETLTEEPPLFWTVSNMHIKGKISEIVLYYSAQELVRSNHKVRSGDNNGHWTYEDI